jgi:hypothetical protein
LSFLGNFPFLTDFAGDRVASGAAPAGETTFPAAGLIAFVVLTKALSLVFGLSAIAQLYLFWPSNGRLLFSAMRPRLLSKLAGFPLRYAL